MKQKKRERISCYRKLDASICSNYKASCAGGGAPVVPSVNAANYLPTALATPYLVEPLKDTCYADDKLMRNI